MIASTSRATRWQTEAGSAVATDAPETEPASAMAMLARTAAETALLASRSASDRLARARRGRRARIGASAGLGAAAVAVFCAFPMMAFAPPWPLVFTGVSALAALASILLLRRQAFTTESEEAIAVVIAKDLALGALALRLGKMVALLEAEPAMSAGACLAELLAEADGEAAGSRARETRIRSATNVPSRRHERIVPRHRRVVLTTADNRKLLATVIDVSCSGVAVEGNFPGCGSGQLVRVGAKPARVVRVLSRGLACEFTEIIPIHQLTADIIL